MRSPRAAHCTSWRFPERTSPFWRCCFGMSCRLLGFSVRATSLATIAGVVGYTLLTDCRPPVIRATLLVCLFGASRLLFRRPALSSGLALAAIAILLWNPSDLFDVGAAALVSGRAGRSVGGQGDRQEAGPRERRARLSCATQSRRRSEPRGISCGRLLARRVADLRRGGPLHDAADRRSISHGLPDQRAGECRAGPVLDALALGRLPSRGGRPDRAVGVALLRRPVRRSTVVLRLSRRNGGPRPALPRVRAGTARVVARRDITRSY